MWVSGLNGTLTQEKVAEKPPNQRFLSNFFFDLLLLMFLMWHFYNGTHGMGGMSQAAWRMIPRRRHQKLTKGACPSS